MKTAYLKIITVLIITSCLYTGCFLNTRENLEKLPDRKFYFTEFQFILPGQNKESAYKFFKDFPVKKIMYMLAKEYNLTIDMSDYNTFIKRKNLSSIETSGLWRISTNTWKKKNIDNHRIFIIFEQDYIYENKMSFTLVMYNNDSIVNTIQFEISKIDTIFNQLTYFLKSGEESRKEFDTKNYGKISPIPMIIEANNETSIVEEPANISKIKTMIEDYVKTLNQEEKNKFKHDIIDFIYQKCN